VINIAIVIALSTTVNLIAFNLAVIANRIFFLVLIPLNVIYSIINVFRIKNIINKSKKNKTTNKKDRMDKVTKLVLAANFGSLVFMAAIIIILIENPYTLLALHWHLMAMIGCLITDFMVTMTFKTNYTPLSLSGRPTKSR